MKVVVDFAEPVEGDPPVTDTMTIRVARWRDTVMGLYTQEFGPIPAEADPEAIRYLSHLGALQGALITDFGLALVPGARLDRAFPDEQELPPESIQPDGHIVLDGQPAQVWATVFRGVRALFGDPSRAPFALIQAHRPGVSGDARPALVTRQLPG